MPIYGEYVPNNATGISWSYGGGASSLVDALGVVDGTYVTTSTSLAKLTTTVGMGAIPATDVLEGIKFRLYFRNTSACPIYLPQDRLWLAVSEDNGATWHTEKELAFCAGDYLTKGDATEMWGITPGTTFASLSQLMFCVYINTAETGPLTPRIDYWGITIYTSSGASVSMPAIADGSTRYVPGFGLAGNAPPKQ